jgi:hypothetical protein
MKPYTWRAAIIKSKLPPTTRHVLLTLSLYINEVGESAYPSIETLAVDTGLTERAVGAHLRQARDAGWLTVAKHGFRGQRWANNEYFPQLPNSEAFEEYINPLKGQESGSEKGQEPRSEPSKGQERRSKGQEPRSSKVRNDVPTNYPDELSRELSNLNTKKTDLLKARQSKFEPSDYLQSLGVDQQTIFDWLTHRKTKKASASMTVIASRIEEAGKARITLTAALKLEISRNWQGFDAGWLAPRQQNNVRLSIEDRRASDNEEARRILFGNKSPEVIDV